MSSRRRADQDSSDHRGMLLGRVDRGRPDRGADPPVPDPLFIEVMDLDVDDGTRDSQPLGHVTG